MVVTLSNHAILRGKQRLGFNCKTLKKISEKAFEKGYTKRDFKRGRVYNFLLNIVKKNLTRDKTMGRICLFGEHIYLFNCRKKLITVLALENKFKNYKTYLKNDTVSKFA